MSEFGRVLREQRRTAGLSQRQLAELVGVDYSYLSKLENGRTPPPAVDTIERLADALGGLLDELLAAARKLPSEIDGAVARCVDAVRFFRLATAMELSGEDWRYLLTVAETRQEETLRLAKEPKENDRER
jgi:transcriptional regulator with XRE-family HTH domain